MVGLLSPHQDADDRVSPSREAADRPSRADAFEGSPIGRTARAAGLHAHEMLTSRDINTRRSQLWLVFAGLFVATSAFIAAAALRPGFLFDGEVPLQWPSVGLVVLSIVFAGYVREKERHLRTLSGLLGDEQAARQQLAVHTERLHTVLTTTASLTRTLDPAEVHRLVLRHAVELVGADEGVLHDIRAGEPVIAAAHPDGRLPSRRLDETSAGVGTFATVAGPRRVAIGVPLIHEGVSIAHLAVSRSNGEPFDETSVRLLEAFAGHAATAMVNARRYCVSVDDRTGSDEHQSAAAEFDWLAGPKASRSVPTERSAAMRPASR